MTPHRESSRPIESVFKTTLVFLEEKGWDAQSCQITLTPPGGDAARKTGSDVWLVDVCRLPQVPGGFLMLEIREDGSVINVHWGE